MKRIIAVSLLVLFLCGCGGSAQLNNVMKLRDYLLKTDRCTFCAHITADYGDAIYTFAVDCSIDQTGSMTFSVVSPESIKGIEGNIDGDKGTLTFDDEALLFELMTDNLLSPICAPWVAMNALRSGYIQSCGVDGEYIKILLDDSYAANTFQVTFWTTKDMMPSAAEISWQNRRFLTIAFTSFSYM